MLGLVGEFSLSSQTGLNFNRENHSNWRGFELIVTENFL